MTPRNSSSCNEWPTLECREKKQGVKYTNKRQSVNTLTEYLHTTEHSTYLQCASSMNRPTTLSCVCTWMCKISVVRQLYRRLMIMYPITLGIIRFVDFVHLHTSKIKYVFSIFILNTRWWTKSKTLGISKLLSLLSQLGLQDQGRLNKCAKWAEEDTKPSLVCRKKKLSFVIFKTKRCEI